MQKSVNIWYDDSQNTEPAWCYRHAWGMFKDGELKIDEDIIDEEEVAESLFIALCDGDEEEILEAVLEAVSERFELGNARIERVEKNGVIEFVITEGDDEV